MLRVFTNDKTYTKYHILQFYLLCDDKDSQREMGTELSWRQMDKLKACMTRAGHTLSSEQLEALYDKHVRVFERLPRDMVVLLLKELDLNSMVALCRVSKSTNKICLENKKLMIDKALEMDHPLFLPEEGFTKRGSRVSGKVWKWASDMFGGDDKKQNLFTINANLRVVKPATLKAPLRDTLNYVLLPGNYKSVSVFLAADYNVFIVIQNGTFVHLVDLTAYGEYKFESPPIIPPVQGSTIRDWFKETFGAASFRKDRQRTIFRAKNVTFKYPIEYFSGTHPNVSVGVGTIIGDPVGTGRLTGLRRIILARIEIRTDETLYPPYRGELWNHPTGLRLLPERQFTGQPFY